MSKNIKIVNLNENAETADLSPVHEATNDEAPAEQADTQQPPPTENPDGDVADDIDTDELEEMLKDLKQVKKQNKQPAKKRVRKPKTVVSIDPEPTIVEPEPVIEEPEPVIEEPIAKSPKPKRKYIRKAVKDPEVAPEPMEPATPRNVAEEPVKRTAGAMIEEMQRAERALRYQMRKNKMQTLVSHAF